MSILKKRIGILTGGGDAPGLNSVIESVVRSLDHDKYECIGICDGFEGIFEQKVKPLHPQELVGVHANAGTILGTSNRRGIDGHENEFTKNFKKLHLDGLVAIGGDGTFAGLKKVSTAIPIVGVPKTIDNDLPGTDVTFGFDTACSVVAEAVDSLRTTAEAHRRVFIIETMGRTTGWISLGGGLAGYADCILLPELAVTRDSLLKFIRKQQQLRRGLIIVASEGARFAGEGNTVAFQVNDSPEKNRLGGFSTMLARWIETETGWESRNVILGHLQRSKPPTTTDRFLTLQMGIAAAQLVKQNQWQQAVVYRSGQIVSTDISELMSGPRNIPQNHNWINLAKDLGIHLAID